MKKLLIVVDFQNDFVTGSLGFNEAPQLENHIVHLIQTFQQNHDDIIYTMDTHQTNYLQTYEGLHLPIAHCIENTPGWQLYGKVKELLSDCTCYKKETFPSLEMAIDLKNKEYESVTLVGLVSHICVLSNAIMVKSALPDTPVRVDLKGCASSDQITHQKSIDVMKSLQIEIIE